MKRIRKGSNDRRDRYTHMVDLHARMFFVLPHPEQAVLYLNCSIGQLGSAARLRNGDYIRPVVKRNRFTERSSTGLR